MTDAIPDLELPRVETRAYFDGRSVFGGEQARPVTTESAERAWDDDQLDAAAHAGIQGAELHPDLLAALCRRYVDIVQRDATHAEETRTLRQQLATVQGVAEVLRAELAGERSERHRLAGLHREASELLAWSQHVLAQVSCDNVYLRHGKAGTTPAAVRAALVSDTEKTQRMRRIDNGGAP